MSRNQPEGVSKGGSIDHKYYYSSSHATTGAVPYLAPSDDYTSTYSSSLAHHKNSQAPLNLFNGNDQHQQYHQVDMMQTMKLPGIRAEKRYY